MDAVLPEPNLKPWSVGPGTAAECWGSVRRCGGGWRKRGICLGRRRPGVGLCRPARTAVVCGLVEMMSAKEARRRGRVGPEPEPVPGRGADVATVAVPCLSKL